MDVLKNKKVWMIVGAIILLSIVLFFIIPRKDMFEQLPQLVKGMFNAEKCTECKEAVKTEMCVDPSSEDCGCQQKSICSGVCNLPEPVELFTEEDKLNEMAWDEYKALYSGSMKECYTGCSGRVMNAGDVCRINCKNICDASFDAMANSPFFTEEDVKVAKAMCAVNCQVTNCTQFVVM
jgi:hypothetical protein